MDSVLENLLKVLDRDTKLETRNALNQGTEYDSNTVVWDETQATIDKDVLEMFKQYIGNKTCKFYKMQGTLPYYEFCLAIVCTLDYTLSTKTLSQVSEKSFKSAWRMLTIAKDIDLHPSLSRWLNDRLGRRTASGYNNYIVDSNHTPSITYKRTLVSSNSSDSRKIFAACMSNNIKDISPSFNSAPGSVVAPFANTPESHLDMLRALEYIIVSRSNK